MTTPRIIHSSNSPYRRLPLAGGAGKAKRSAGRPEARQSANPYFKPSDWLIDLLQQDQPTLTDRICFWIMIGLGLVSSYLTVTQ